jgi:alpha-ribazole phosphatase
MRIIVVRHYKTLINQSGQIMGWGDSPRSVDWQVDLAYVDGVLSANSLEFAAVYTSNLERARQTGMYYAKKRNINLIHDQAELNEINYGILYKKSKKWVEKHVPKHKKDPDFIYPKGESFHQMQERSVGFIQSLWKKRKHDTILVVVHAGVVRGLVSYFLELPYAENLKRKISHCYIGDFLFKHERCVSYNELGKPSGFVQDGVIAIPYQNNPEKNNQK